MYLFTSGRDYRPAAVFGGHLPPDTVYARIVVAAPDLARAEATLHGLGLGCYAETLREPTGSDAPAAALAEHVRVGAVTATAVFVVYRIDTDGLGGRLPSPAFLVAQIRDDYLAAVGQVGVVGAGRRAVCRIVDAPGPTGLRR